MTIRKRRRGTPGFGIPSPFNPTSGQHESLVHDGVFPYCAMMQVAAADDYDDYVICRGFDIRIRKFVDYEYGNSDKPGISVAKPFGHRAVNVYWIGGVYCAFLPTQGHGYVAPSPTDVDWRVGQNPGVAGDGHPDDLADSVGEMTDHNGKYVNWMLIDSEQPWHLVKLDAVLSAGSSALATIWDDVSTVSSPVRTITVTDWLLQSGETISSGKKLTAKLHSKSLKWIVDGAECE